MGGMTHSLGLVARRAWCEALEIPHCQPGDNFFELGGDSLRAVVVTQLIHDETGIEVPLEAMFTSEDFAEYVAAIAPGTDGGRLS